MRSLAKVALVATMIASALVPATTTVGAAGGSSCVSKAEYRSVRKGMTMTRLHQVLDTRGQRYSFETYRGWRGQVRVYDGCGSDSYVAVGLYYRPGGVWRVYDKAASWAS